MDLRNIPDLASKMYEVVLKYNWLTEQMNKNLYIPDYEIKTILDSLKTAYWSMEARHQPPPPVVHLYHNHQVPSQPLPLPYNIPVPQNQNQHQQHQHHYQPIPIQMHQPLHPGLRDASPQLFRRSEVKRHRDDDEPFKRRHDGNEPVKRRYFDKSSDYVSLNTGKSVSKARCTNGPDCKFRPNCRFTHEDGK